MKSEREPLSDKRAAKEDPPTEGYKLVRDGGDKAVRGFALRVTAGGTRTWVLHYSAKATGEERRMTIGRVKEWPIKKARERAAELRRLVDTGGDPLRELQEARGARTVNELADRYLAEHVAAHNRPSSKRDVESLLDQWIRPQLGSEKVAGLRHADIARFHRKVTEAGTPYRANRALAVLSKMMSLAVRWELRPDSPVKGVQRNQEIKRHRYLSGDEILKLTAALTKHPNQTAANAVRLLLLTGARRNEVLLATWDQFDLERAVWTKPGATTKQRTEHRVPLSGPAVKLLTEMREADPKAKSPFPPMRIDKAWASICAAAGFAEQVELRTKSGKAMPNKKGERVMVWKPTVRVHDLRHTYASVLASAGQSLPVIGALLGHTQPSTTARYAHLFDDPLRAATERVGAIIDAATRGNDRSAGVRKMPRRR